MRVIHVVPTAFGESGLFGGGERYPLELARSLAKSIDCELLTFGRESSETVDPSGLRVRVLRSVLVRGHPAQPLAPSLMSSLQAAQIVHTHHLKSMPSKMAALHGLVRRQNLVATDHGLDGSDWGGLLPSLFQRFLTVSEYSARQLRVQAKQTSVIYGGADPRRFFPDRAVERSGVLFVGRLTPHKGIDRLIESLPSTARLLIAGSEGHDAELPERGYPGILRKMSVDRDVSFLGSVPDESLPGLYRSARAFVLPSVHLTCYGRRVQVSELLGLSVLEAMASGTPVIGSAVGGLPEIIDDGVTGFLVQPGDTRELRYRLEELIGNPPLAERMGKHARELLMQKFTWERCAERCLRIYHELSGSSASNPANIRGDSQTLARTDDNCAPSSALAMH